MAQYAPTKTGRASAVAIRFELVAATEPDWTGTPSPVIVYAYLASKNGNLLVEILN